MLGCKHGCYYKISEDSKNVLKYRELYYNFIKYLKQYSKDIIILSSTPDKQKNNLKKWNDSSNQEIEARNNIQKEIAINNNIKFIDIYQLVKFNNYPYIDFCHLADKSCTNQVALYINDEINCIKKDITFYKHKTTHRVFNILGIKIKIKRKQRWTKT